MVLVQIFFFTSVHKTHQHKLEAAEVARSELIYHSHCFSTARKTLIGPAGLACMEFVCSSCVSVISSGSSRFLPQTIDSVYWRL